jgi:hypothetical protein
MRFLTGVSFLLCSMFSTAHGGAWVPEKDSGKVIANRIEQKQAQENVDQFRHREKYQSLLLEYGLSDKFALAVKHGRQMRKQPNGTDYQDDSRLGIMFDTPALASGLLPPFIYRLAKATLPFKKMSREKRASMTLGLQDEVDIQTATLAMADKISIGRFHIGQEIELDQIRGGGRFSRNWLYRFTLGFGPLTLGSEAANFVDYRSSYASLTHSYYGQWSPRGRAWHIRLKDGTSRAPLGNAGVQKNDYLVLEMQIDF